MGEGRRRFALVLALGGVAAAAAALIFASELEAGSEEAGGGVILVGVLAPIGFAIALALLEGETRFLRDAATIAGGYAFVLGLTAAWMRTIDDASRGYTFFVVAGYFFVVGWVAALLMVAALNLMRRGLRMLLGRASEDATGSG